MISAECRIFFHLQSQETPFPLYPWLHIQVKFSEVLKHVALESQLLVVALAHLSVHRIIMMINEYFFYFPHSYCSMVAQKGHVKVISKLNISIF